MNIPANLKYTKDHEWVKVTNGNEAIVGITEFAAHELGDIVYVEIDTIGETIEREEAFGTIEAVKTVSDMFMPVTAEVVEFNEGLEANPDLINKDPYGEGWMAKIKVTDMAQLDELLSAAEYTELVGA